MDVKHRGCKVIIPKHIAVRKLDDNANIDIILTAVIAGVVFAVAIPIIFGVFGGLNLTTIDQNIAVNIYGGAGSGDAMNAYNNSTAASNASALVLANVVTFFTIGPIYLVVIAAVGIITAILMLRRR